MALFTAVNRQAKAPSNKGVQTVPSTIVLQLEAAKVKRRLISLDLCLFSQVNQQCGIVLNVVETCSTR
jgi:hypothetical protein